MWITKDQNRATLIIMMKYILPLLLYVITNLALAATKHDIEIIKFKFSPAEITIEAGDTIRWTNKEKRQYHSVWFEQLGEPEPDYFFPDEFFERTFDKEGEFPYRCGPHPRMTGVVHVKKAGAKKAVDTNPDATKESVANKGVANKSEEKQTQKKAVEAVKKDSIATDIPQERREEIFYLLKHDCGSCHGMTLQGGLGPALLPEALEKLTEEQVAFTITHGRPGTPMPPWKLFFNEQETGWLAQQLKQGIKSPTKDKTE